VGKANKYKQAGPPRERVEELTEALGSGALDGPLTDAEVLALATAAAKASEPDWLVALWSLADGKQQRKAINQARYRLVRSGVDVPELKERAQPVSLAVEAPQIDDLPLIMSPPYTNAGRVFFFPYLRGRQLWFVQAFFEQPAGLTKLEATPTSRSTFRQMVGGIADMRSDDGVPELVTVGNALVDRKLWEIGVAVREGATGAQVDHEATEVIDFPKEAPPHPAESLELGEVELLSVAQLDSESYAIAPFLHQAVVDRLDAKAAEIEESVLALTDAQIESRHVDAEQAIVAEWLAEWGVERAREVLLDCAYYHAEQGRPAVAATFLSVVRGPEERLEGRVAAFLGRAMREIRLAVKDSPRI